MKKIIFVCLLAGLAGCASNSQYGNFAEGSSPITNKRLADDSVKQLLATFPPASTRFNVGQPVEDSYGRALTSSLRVKGYSLMEYRPDVKSGESAQPASSGKELRYVVDNLSGTNLYQVSLLIGKQSLSRAYVLQNNTVLPAGPWVMKQE
ncbi:conjugative transfer protein TrbH [Pseudomonas duriflava]|uniref:Conjugative transfer protein TrbH n=1 Tax=Pseudomonas duriflava TaxID=459528 RepID=A0A562PQ27_9PSED|nr:conjugal transfer protein TrbH [Pseudomonas duriflava]TWI46166.1 conjugative transfer protein TrbH [Pseudomonas duriflava]